VNNTTKDDEARARYLRDKVMTATPAQRVVMLYDRFALDLTRAYDARTDENPDVYNDNLAHAMEILAELQSSLDITVGGPTANLSSLYTHLLLEIIKARSGDHAAIVGAKEIVNDLGAAFRQVAAETAPSAAASAGGAWFS
jgi:flagellar protein FliS